MKTNLKEKIGLTLLAQAALLGQGIAQQQAPIDRTILPIREPARTTCTELDVRNVPAPKREALKAPDGAPNVVIILIDDMGFGASETFGGPIHMPNFSKLANSGLRYNRFHTTA